MVLICNNIYSNTDKYEEHFQKYPYSLSDFQKYAIEAIVEGHHVLVTAHTGSGKTLPAEFAIEYFVEMGKKVIYTSPIKALSNQKYYEFTQKYPNISFGLITGDIKINPTASVLIMTAEIFMNYLFVESNEEKDNTPTNTELFQIDIKNELACVIMDEIHYINDAERGSVWEKTILMLPDHIQMVMLSATIDSPESFAKWCERDSLTGKQVYLCNTNKRVVPLTHYSFLTTTEMIFKRVKDKSLQTQIRNTTNCLIKIQDENGKFYSDSYVKIMNMKKMFETNEILIKRNHVLNKLCVFLKENDMLPAIVFVFSRKQVELFASEITTNLLEDDSKIPYIVRRESEQIIRKLSNYQEYLNLPEYNQVVSLLEKGIGIHHSGMIPVLREIVELMISKKYIKILFATESFAVGLSCPIRTAVFSSLTKFDGTSERYLLPHEYTQSAGRAGRRGIDTIGHVVHCNNLFHLPSEYEYKTIMGGKPQILQTKIAISLPLVLNLCKKCNNNDEIANFIEKSMLQKQIEYSIKGNETKYASLEVDLDKLKKSLGFLRTPRDICEEYNRLKIQLPSLFNKKKKEAERRIQLIQDEHRIVKEDASSLQKIKTLEDEILKIKSCIDYEQQYINTKVKQIYSILYERGFVESAASETVNIKLTRRGEIANTIAEINPIVFTDYLFETDFMKSMTTKQIIGFLSCFIDVKVNPDSRVSVPNTDDSKIKYNISIFQEITKIYESFDCVSLSNSQSCNDLEMSYDMIDHIIKWCDCSDEMECKLFIQDELSSKSVSIGDFTKGVLKISAISKELMTMCEKYEKIELLEKLGSIDSMILKYITTAQSLYL